MCRTELASGRTSLFVDLCLEVEANLVVGAKLIVNKNAMAPDDEEESAVANNAEDAEEGQQELSKSDRL